jgi:Ni,Fe-hydrogenase III large subunit
MSTRIHARLSNSQAMDISAVPRLPIESFQEEVLSAIGAGQRVASMFGHRDESGRVWVYAVLADDVQHVLSIISSEVGDSYPSLTPRCPQVHMFEREIYEQLDVKPEGHPWLKPVRVHDFKDGNNHDNSSLRYRYFKMSGEEVHEVAVGPVHAGVIEPGHFRFQCHGEVVYHLEIHLGYQHRGIEEALIGGPHKRTIFQMETVAGDTSIGHGMAYCQAMEALTGIEATPRAQAIRAIALELERLANHVGDIGALANDVGFLPTAAFCGRLRGGFLNMTALICGSRFGRGLIHPGGVAFDIDARMINEMLKRLQQAERDVTEAIDIFFDSQSVLNRLDGTGPVSAQACQDLGIVGMTARASGVARDVRTDHPFGWYRDVTITMALLQSGDVFARAMVRWLEIEHSIEFVMRQLQALPDGDTTVETTELRPDQICAAMVEGWRGELVHVAITDEQGRFARYKITDPSFHNWAALAMALRGQQVSDFPLCNKSFNLSYCGFDL